MAVASALVPLVKPDRRTSLESTSPGEKETKKVGKSRWSKRGRRSKSILSPFRCEECPLLEDEEDISDEEMEQLVSIFKIFILVSFKL